MRRILSKQALAIREEFQAKIADLNPDAEDLAAINEWLGLKSVNWFEGKTVDGILDWMADNLLDDLTALKAKNSYQKAAGTPSEPELEDAYNWVECSLVGSEKQVNRAKSIAHNHHFAIVQAQKAGKPVPTKASWWIENRGNIVVGLPL